MTHYLIAGLVGTAVAAALAALAPLAARLRGRGGDPVRARIDREFRGAGAAESLLALGNIRELAAGGAAGGRSTAWRRLAWTLERAGLGITPGQLLAGAGAAAVGLGLTAWVVQENPLVAAAAAAAGGVGPVLYAAQRARKRDEALLAQLPEALDLAARFLKAGHSLAQALGSVGGELKDPARGLFARYVSQRDLGLPTEVTLRDLAERAGLTEYRIMVLAVLVQQQTGGNLSEVCERLAATVRERFRVKGMIRALTAEGRLQANILIALPAALALIMTVVKPSYAEAMFSQPKLIAGIVVSQLLGVLWIRKIVNVTF